MIDLTRDAVLRAVAEYDRLGREHFLSKYGFGTAKSYYIVVNGERYDSKAIAGVAHGYARPDLGPLRFSDFSGGEAEVQRPLSKLGFEVYVDRSPERKRSRNPAWTRDELILALDYYLHHPGESHDDASPGVKALSTQINSLAKFLGHGNSETLRNPNGVSMKLLNFRSHDPQYVSRGQVGLKRGNSLEKELWDRFAQHKEEIRKIAASISHRISSPDEELRESLSGTAEPDIAEAEEGRLVTRLHLFRERNRSIVKRKKESYAKKHGRVCCEACGFDFSIKYGKRGEGFIECHHTKPVSALSGVETTKLSDLALLCANCHRMVHAKTPWLTIEELKALLCQ